MTDVWNGISNELKYYTSESYPSETRSRSVDDCIGLCEQTTVPLGDGPAKEYLFAGIAI